MPTYDYLPGADGEFAVWVAQFSKVLAADPAGCGRTPAEAAAVAAKVAAWQAAYQAHGAAQREAETATLGKVAARKALAALIRSTVRQIQADPAVTNSQRAALAITVPDLTPTPAHPPTEPPLVKVSHGERLQHTIHFFQPTGGRRARPKGTRGCEIWVKLAPPNTPPVLEKGGHPTDMRFLALDTATPYTAAFSSADVGKTAYYLCRWISTRGVAGPWSETIEATVAG